MCGLSRWEHSPAVGMQCEVAAATRDEREAALDLSADPFVS